MTKNPTSTEVARLLMQADTIDEMEDVRPLIKFSNVEASEVLAEIFNIKFDRLCLKQRSPQRAIKKPERQ